ncbi:MAG TPA: stalk domain-containing protein [Candidatus Elarobacter sp.]|nr:stalk domain-containing protein [Candidatus Elarobacter sp.]
MKRALAGLLLAATVAVASPALAADRAVGLTLDGRPVDRAGGVAVLHNGVIYGDVVDLVKSFDGLLTFQGNAVAVTINGVNARFTTGSRTAMINDGAVTMEGQAFVRNGDIFVPLNTFVTRVAQAKLRVNPARTHADIFVNASPS